MKLTQFQSKWAFLSKRKVFVACSGGVDSVVLLHCLKSICFDLEVLHVNYSLRGEDSNLDEQFVRTLCEQLQIKLIVKKVNTKDILQNQGGNLQKVARLIRYELFEEQLEQYPGSYVALGQHADDQIETFFQHLARKSGVLGLACMLPIHKCYIRPLLEYSKQELLEYALEQKLSWREDVSNSENKYTRNRLRNIFLPSLYAEFPTLKSSVLTLVNAFQETHALLLQQAEEIIMSIKQEGFWSFESYDIQSNEVRLEVLRYFGGDKDVLNQLSKIRQVQKGKFVSCADGKIYRETLGFSFVFGVNTQSNELIVEQVIELPKSFSKDVIYLDEHKISGELRLRKWRLGDRISPIGMKGSKLISDVLTEANVMTSVREDCLVLVDDQEVHWCVGYKISRKSIADKNSKSILKVQIVEK